MVKGTGHRSGGRNVPRVLSSSQEGELADRIAKVANMGFPITSDRVRQCAYEFASSRGIKGFSNVTNNAGPKWFKGFIKRHPILNVKQAQQISCARAKAVTKEAIYKWFDEYKRVLEKKKINDPHCIWNVDETGCPNIPRKRKYVGVKGKPLNQVVGLERPETSTAIICVSAAGDHMPPVIIHKGQHVQEAWKAKAPPGFEVKASAKGFVTDAIFNFWGEKFVAFLGEKGLADKQHVLILDGHGSHIYNYPFMANMARNNIEVLSLEPHTTHATCPVDQSPFFVLKRNYMFLLDIWSQNNHGKPLPKNKFFSVFCRAWVFARSLKYIQAGFRITGLYPVNPDAIPDERFAQSAMMDEEDDDSDGSKSKLKELKC